VVEVEEEAQALLVELEELVDQVEVLDQIKEHLVVQEIHLL